MKVAAGLLSTILLAASVTAATPDRTRKTPAPRLTAEQVLQQIEADGAQKALDELYASDATWSPVIRGVSSGTKPWLRVAERLKPVGGPSTTELIGAVSAALERSPANVLSILGGEFDVTNVCSLNTFEDLLGSSYSAALRRVDLRRRAVAAVADPKLKATRDECRAFLDELRTNVVRSRADWFPQP